MINAKAMPAGSSMVAYEPRPYQAQALDDVFRAMVEEPFVLLQAATGAGKTILFSELVKQCLLRWRMRVLILAHRELLVRQSYDKLVKVWPEAAFNVGLACASAGQVELGRPVTIGSPQTLANRLGDTPPVDLIIIDEAHRVPPAGAESQYQAVLDTMRGYRPNMRVLGVTATPFRLGHGLIYGKACKRGARNWWPRLHSRIGIADLVELGYLAPYRGKAAVELGEELAGVKKSAGDYNLQALGDMMGREVHIQSAVKAYEDYGEGRAHVVAFCVVITHAQRLAEAFNAAGHRAVVVHSQMTHEERQRAMADFEEGRAKIICNVGVLTEGWDCTAVDCVLMCRPTMSPALWVQMVGRALRVHPGKADALVLDLSDNWLKHGDPDDPTIEVPTGGKAPKKTEPRAKICPECQSIAPPAASVCPQCGHEWKVQVVEVARRLEMRPLADSPRPLRIVEARAEPFTSRAGNKLLRLTLACREAGNVMTTFVHHYWDVEGRASDVGRIKAQSLWRNFGAGPPPQTVEEAILRFGQVRLPPTVMVKPNGKFLNVVGYVR